MIKNFYKALYNISITIILYGKVSKIYKLDAKYTQLDNSYNFNSI